MIDRFRPTPPLLPNCYGVTVVAASILAATHFHLSSVVGTDDAYIYFRIARHIWQELGPVFNPGDSHTPATSLLWSYVLAYTARLFDSDDFPTIAQNVTTTLFFGSSVFLSLSFRRYLGIFSVLAPFALASISLFHSLVGLEICFAVFSLSVALWCFFVLRSPAATGAAVALAFFCRADAVLIGAPLGLLAIWGDTDDPEQRPKRPLLRMCISFLGVFATGTVLHYRASGQVLPATLHAKVVQGQGHWTTFAETIGQYLELALGLGWIGAFFAVVGLLATRIVGACLFMAAVLQASAYSLLSVADYPWYSWQIMLSIRILVVFGIVATVWFAFSMASTALHQQGMRSAGVRTSSTFGLVILLFSIAWLSWELLSSPSTKRLEAIPAMSASGPHKTYYDIAEKACMEASDTSGSFAGSEVLLAQEIGIVGYLCPRLQVRDVNGLASPGINSKTLDNWAYWVRRYRPRFLSLRGGKGRILEFETSNPQLKLRYLRTVYHLEFGFPVSLYERLGSRGSPSSVVWYGDRGRQIVFRDGFEDASMAAWSKAVRSSQRRWRPIHTSTDYSTRPRVRNRAAIRSPTRRDP